MTCLWYLSHRIWCLCLFHFSAHRVCCTESPSPDNNLFKKLALTYAQPHLKMKTGNVCPRDKFDQGITNGAFWYEVRGEYKLFLIFLHKSALMWPKLYFIQLLMNRSIKSEIFTLVFGNDIYWSFIVFQYLLSIVYCISRVVNSILHTEWKGVISQVCNCLQLEFCTTLYLKPLYWHCLVSW